MWKLRQIDLKLLKIWKYSRGKCENYHELTWNKYKFQSEVPGDFCACQILKRSSLFKKKYLQKEKTEKKSPLKENLEKKTIEEQSYFVKENLEKKLDN